MAERAPLRARSRIMVQSPDPPPDDATDDALPPDQARERDLARRSHNPALSPWLILGVILLAGAGVYVVSALI
ncbi:hypothetical protein [Brevundimonas naejangsanensis]|uniref:hypothetical protein n=1 Tax=Brevundimonas naejangsanensis TaxID=588932 RepID=UPI0026F364D5|nr:hypothetical protein [Brevundimonas naejangsanensis]